MNVPGGIAHVEFPLCGLPPVGASLDVRGTLGLFASKLAPTHTDHQHH